VSAAFDSKREAIVGRLGEIAAAEAMRLDGASTIALCRIDDGGAPMLETGAVRRDRAVLPDLQVFNLRALPGAIFVEIKTYEQPGTNEKGRFRTHGIPVRLFNHYVSNENKTGIPVYLAINELDSGELRLSAVPLSKLWKDPCQCRGCRVGLPHVANGRGIREPQWYFDRDDFSIVYRHSNKTIETLRREHSRLIKEPHVHRRHGQAIDGSIVASGLLTAGKTDRKCQHCGRQDGTMFRVARPGVDSPMCGECWRAGIDPEQSVRTRLLRTEGTPP
jgi:hypothetical protein